MTSRGTIRRVDVKDFARPRPANQLQWSPRSTTERLVLT